MPSSTKIHVDKCILLFDIKSLASKYLCDILYQNSVKWVLSLVFDSSVYIYILIPEGSIFPIVQSAKDIIVVSRTSSSVY